MFFTSWRFNAVSVLIVGLVVVLFASGAAFADSPRSNEASSVSMVTVDNALFSVFDAPSFDVVENEFVFGDPFDQPLLADLDGNGVVSPVVFRSSVGQFFIKDSMSVGNADGSFFFGLPGDVGLFGDWDGDGVDSPGVYRPSSQTFFLSNAPRGDVGPVVSFMFGDPGDVPVVGDFNGNGFDTVSVYRSSVQTFFVPELLGPGFGPVVSFMFGDPGDVPVVADFNSNGVDELGVFRASSSRVFFATSPVVTVNVSDGSGVVDGPNDVTTVLFGVVAKPLVPASTTTSTVPPVTTSSTVPADTTTSTVPASSTTSTLPASTTTLPATTTTTSTVPPTTTSTVPPTTTSTVPPVTTTTSTLPPSTTTTSTVPPPPPSGYDTIVPIVSGVHARFEQVVESNTAYMCEPGAVLDGGGVETIAFWSPGADNVLIDGCEIRNYVNPAQQGAINMDGDFWVVSNNNIHDNWGVGIQMNGDYDVVSDNWIHHQHQMGIGGGGVGGLVEGNEISFNNWLVEFDWGWEAGGTKFWESEGMIVRGNYSHDNHGPGFWDDFNNNNILYEDNLVEDNFANGIFHEIGYAAIIRNNTIRRNGFGHDVWLWGPGILIAASQDTQVYGNLLEDNFNGITLVQQDRGPGNDFQGDIQPLGPWIVQNNFIHDNTLINTGITGAVTDTDSDAIFSANNRFEGNDYVGDVSWAWNEGSRSWAQWQEFGHDLTGSFLP